MQIVKLVRRLDALLEQADAEKAAMSAELAQSQRQATALQAQAQGFPQKLAEVRNTECKCAL